MLNGVVDRLQGRDTILMAKESLHPLLDAENSIVSGDEEKADVL